MKQPISMKSQMIPFISSMAIVHWGLAVVYLWILYATSIGDMEFASSSDGRPRQRKPISSSLIDPRTERKTEDGWTETNEQEKEVCVFCLFIPLVVGRWVISPLRLFGCRMSHRNVICNCVNRLSIPFVGPGLPVLRFDPSDYARSAVAEFAYRLPLTWGLILIFGLSFTWSIERFHRETKITCGHPYG